MEAKDEREEEEEKEQKERLIQLAKQTEAACLHVLLELKGSQRGEDQ